MTTTFGTGFAQANFSYDPNLSPYNQAFSGATLAVVQRQNPLVLAGITIGSASITSETVGTATIGTATIGQLNVSGTATFNALVAEGPTAGVLLNLTPDTGTFTGTFGGLTAAVTGVAYWARVGNLITLQLPPGTGSSNATAFSFAPLPAEIIPSRIQNIALGGGITNNGSAVAGGIQINTATVNFFTANFGAFTASGAKAFGLGNAGSWPISWTIAP